MKFITLTTALLLSLVAFSQTQLKGSIRDTNNQPLFGASVYVVDKKQATTSDLEGKYQLTDLKEGSIEIVFKMLGYKTVTKQLHISANETLQLSVVLEEALNSLDEVVISASRNSEYLSEIPASISVVNQNKIEELTNSTTNINEILEFTVPGLAVSTGTFSNWGQTLRGRSLLVMVDGIPQSTPLRNGQLGIKSINPNDISRVEVIKGATSIFGNGGNGGFINYITKKPTATQGLEATTNLWGTANVAKTKDALGFGVYQSLKGKLNKFNYFISGSYEQTGNKYDANRTVILPTYGLGNTDLYSTLAKLSYQIADNQKITLSTNLYKSQQDSPYIPVLGAFEVFNSQGAYSLTAGYGVEGSVEGQQPSGTTLLNGQLTYNLNELFSGSTDFTTDIYYQKAKNVFFYSDKFEGGGQSVINAQKFGLRPNFNTKLLTDNENHINLTYGLDLLKDKTNQGLLDGRLWVPNINMMSWAPYLQTTLKLKEEWVFKAGLRYDDMNLDIDSYNTLPYSPLGDENFNPSVSVEGGKIDFNNLAFNAGIRFIKHREFIPYLSYSQGFSIADLGSVLRSATANNINDILLEPAVTKNYEFGFMSKLDRLKLAAVAYYSTSNLGTGVVFDEQINSFVPSKKPQNIYGGELSLDYTSASDMLQLGTSYSYVEGTTQKATNSDSIIYLGGDVIAAPKLTTYVNWNPIKKLNTSLRLTHLGNRNRFDPYLNANNNYTYRHGQFPVESYTVLNYLASYQIDSNTTVSLALNNLLNAYYLPARSQWSAPLRSFVAAGEGMNSRLSLRYTF